MWIQIRSMDGKISGRIEGLSKLTKIEDLRAKIQEYFDVAPERQRLFFSGKQVSLVFYCINRLQLSLSAFMFYTFH